jgi:hypothetical protein
LSPLQLLSVLLRLPPLSPLVRLLSRQESAEAASTTRMPMLAEQLLLLWPRLLRPWLRLAHTSQQRCLHWQRRSTASSAGQDLA